ncbi:MAG: hypothetical protein G3W71_19430 [Xanthomonas perforans]|uniref:Uncharacterized protein n=1 Tax=Xanthomonas perforans TaxID=442694 RepID=A0A6L9VWM6_XANPE|nr:hypothetical protein [Xanthomonas perforans]NEK78984.1 hypothetical protein [Xanthomonas perforans]NEL27209.1 hypothetical protein [Xanthomonas perforans]NEL40217.1 hypothetical protein [Xanthomonas perforans]NEL65286.1 hypothetical protein [Xanthomonas perforans]
MEVSIEHTTPKGLIDYVVRFTHLTRPMRTIVYRAPNEGAAVELAVELLQQSAMSDWMLLDVVTMEESIARRGGIR